MIRTLAYALIMLLSASAAQGQGYKGPGYPATPAPQRPPVAAPVDANALFALCVHRYRGIEESKHGRPLYCFEERFLQGWCVSESQVRTGRNPTFKPRPC